MPLGLGDRYMKEFVWQLGKLGFVWQFITVRIRISFCSFFFFLQCALVIIAWWLAFERVHLRPLRKGRR